MAKRRWRCKCGSTNYWIDGNAQAGKKTKIRCIQCHFWWHDTDYKYLNKLGGEGFSSKPGNKKRKLDTPICVGSARQEVSRGYVPMQKQVMSDTSTYPRNPTIQELEFSQSPY